MLSYVAITPARNESENLVRLASAVEHQTVVPHVWVIVDDWSTDETFQKAEALAERLPWVRALRSPLAHGNEGALTAGRTEGRDVVAFMAGVASVEARADVIVKLDADVSFEPDFFERLLSRFEASPSLGITSGLCYEHEGGVWRPRHVTKGHVRGATRAYRRACFEQVSPLVNRLGWDTIDEVKARLSGWETMSILDLPFLHHRALGARDGARREWVSQGRLSYFLGYRPSYLLVRTVFRARKDVSALGLLWGFGIAWLRGDPRYHEPGVVARLREEQRLRKVIRRAIQTWFGQPRG